MKEKKKGGTANKQFFKDGLNWNVHIDRVTKKAKSILFFFLHQNLRMTNEEIKTKAYISMVS